MFTASICTIGDEILIGQIVDTNSSNISRALGSIGVKTTRMLSIGDDRQEIISNLANELKINNIVIVTGGLGPTKDDITKDALAELSGSNGYYEHEGQLEKVKAILSSRGLEMLDINRAQASVPDKCEVFVNQNGTAAIMAFHFPSERFGHEAVLYSLPGVPHEAIGALPDIIEDINKHFALDVISHKVLMTYGMAESALSKKIENWEDSLPSDMHLAYLPNLLTGVRLRLSIYGGDKTQHEARLNEQIAGLKAIINDYIYAEEDTNLQTVIGRLLLAHGKTMAAAESCTGGTISALMTSIAGSSAYYLGSVTSYAVSVKENVLGVNPEIIETKGVVSAETAEAMANGARRITGADYAVATTGIAGPGGATEIDPVGTVWIGVSSSRGSKSARFVYNNDRIHNIERFAATALNLLRLEIIENEKLA